jgi:hypothetical protein
MSEKRKPEIVLFAKKSGKKTFRIELYPAKLWPHKRGGGWVRSQYRVRIGGKWQFGDKTFTEGSF